MARGHRVSCALHQVCPDPMGHHALPALQPQAWIQNYIRAYRAQRMLRQVVTTVTSCRDALTILVSRRLRACEEAILPISKAKASRAWITLGFTLWLSLPQWGGNISPLKYMESPFCPDSVFGFYLLTDSIASHFALVPVTLITVIPVFRSAWDKTYSKPTRCIRQRLAWQKAGLLYLMKIKN